MPAPADPTSRIFWPFKPDWETPFRVRYSFLTDILTSDAGVEQRRALRSTPRKTVSYSCAFENARLRDFQQIMATAQNLSIVLPEFPRYVRTMEAIAGGATTVHVDAVPPWLVPGSEVVISELGALPKVASVAAVAGTLVTFGELVGPWGTGARLTYAVTGNLREEMPIRLLTDSVGETDIELSVDPGSEIWDFGAQGPLYLSREILDVDPNWISPIEASSVWPVSNVDVEYGRRVTYRPVDFQTSILAMDILLPSIAEVEAFVSFFGRMRGSRGEFFFPSLTNDMTASLAPMNGQTLLRVAGEEVFKGYATDPVRVNIRLSLKDGTTIDRGISAMAIAAGGGSTDITIDTAWPSDIPLDQISTISWLINQRFATDELEIEWLTDSVAQTRVSLRSLPMFGAADYTRLRSTVEGDDRETVVGDDREVIYI